MWGHRSSASDHLGRPLQQFDAAAAASRAVVLAVHDKTPRGYRDQILAPGGTKPAAKLIEDFLGRPGDLRAFKAWLSGPTAS